MDEGVKIHIVGSRGMTPSEGHAGLKTQVPGCAATVSALRMYAPDILD